MLKMYVGLKINLQHRADEFVEKLHEGSKRMSSENGFASAEMIALAVVGVLLVFGIYQIFNDQIGKLLKDWLPSIFSPDGSGGCGGGCGTPTTGL